MTTYNQRLNALENRRTWTLSGAGLSWKDDKGGAGHYPWESLQSVRLRFEPSRAERRRVALRLKTDRGSVQITNIDYRGIMDFELQQDEFRSFVEAFHSRFSDDTPVVFNKGSTWTAFILNILSSILFTLFIIVVLFYLNIAGSSLPVVIAKLVFIIFLMPVMYMLVIVNKPKRYVPSDWPRELLK